MITEQVRGYFGFERIPFDRSWRCPSCSPPPAIMRPWPGSGTRSPPAAWPPSPGRPAPGRPSRPAPRPVPGRLPLPGHLPAQPPSWGAGVPRRCRHGPGRGSPVPPRHPHPAGRRRAGRRDRRARKAARAPGRRGALLSHDQLEAIRMLTNSDLDSASPLAAVLTGQPQLRQNMKLGVLAALDQRITVRYAMQPMTLQETTGYLRHHTRSPAAPTCCSATTPPRSSTTPPAATRGRPPGLPSPR